MQDQWRLSQPHRCWNQKDLSKLSHMGPNGWAFVSPQWTVTEYAQPQKGHKLSGSLEGCLLTGISTTEATCPSQKRGLGLASSFPWQTGTWVDWWLKYKSLWHHVGSLYTGQCCESGVMANWWLSFCHQVGIEKTNWKPSYRKNHYIPCIPELLDGRSTAVAVTVSQTRSIRGGRSNSRQRNRESSHAWEGLKAHSEMKE